MAFWPQHVEKEGPWQRLADLSVNKPMRKEGSQASKVSDLFFRNCALGSCHRAYLQHECAVSHRLSVSTGLHELRNLPLLVSTGLDA